MVGEPLEKNRARQVVSKGVADTSNVRGNKGDVSVKAEEVEDANEVLAGAGCTGVPSRRQPGESRGVVNQDTEGRAPKRGSPQDDEVGSGEEFEHVDADGGKLESRLLLSRPAEHDGEGRQARAQVIVVVGSARGWIEGSYRSGG